MPVTLVRHGKATYVPALDTPLQPDDAIIAVGRRRAFDTMADALFYDHTVEYLATGRHVPATWLWRSLRRH